MNDEEEWPPAESPAEWVWEIAPGAAPHFGHLESVVLEPEQIKAETRRRKRAAKRGFGFQ